MPDLVLIPLVWAIALGLDRLLGEPVAWHPLVGFGRCAQLVERCLNRGRWRFLRGLLAVAIMLLPVYLVSVVSKTAPFAAAVLLDCVLLYLAIGWCSMQQHIAAVTQGFAVGGLDSARQEAAKLVSRDLTDANESEIANAMVETTLENSCDALFASLFWYAAAGSTGVVLHRLVNTLDAMWGYRNARFETFGKVAARLDDLLAFIPSQLTALTYASFGRRFESWRCWWQQGWRWKSINAGSVMASGAASLSLRLGGEACYGGQRASRPYLGITEGRSGEFADLPRVFTLVRHSLWLWFALTLVPVGLWLLFTAVLPVI